MRKFKTASADKAELPNRLTEIKALKDRPIILVCRTDKGSAKAAAILRDAGFRDVHVPRWHGGVERRYGLPVEGWTWERRQGRRS